ncbi:MAG: methylated-DNA-protein-cysteine methyltransferase related protein [Thermoplasmata archaeon]|jgi:methylated-DNA-protein-cysteine methyltransferase-like protein|nr:methylated-DNA-protein-cysteine methyltransferase related protein [Thermoplasmata archaeon]
MTKPSEASAIGLRAEGTLIHPWSSAPHVPPKTGEKYHEAVARVVKRIPKGRVASYKMVATIAGYPRTARFVGRALQLAHGIPWWRVLGQDGAIRIVNPDWRREQYDRLRAEGVKVDAEGRVDMARYAWRPRS